MHLTIDIPNQATRSIPLKRKTLLIGRDPAADVPIDRDDMPALLCQLQAQRDGSWIVRLPADARHPAPRELPLLPGRPLSLGPLTILLAGNAPPSKWRCPGCSAKQPAAAVLCTRCGFDRRLGRCIGPLGPPPSLTPPPVYDTPTGRPPAPAAPPEARAAVLPWFELGAPVLTILLSCAALAALRIAFPPDQLWRDLLRLVLACILNTAALVAGVLIASHWGVVDFGDVHRGVLKCLAVVLFSLALGAAVDPFVTKLAFPTLPPASATIATAIMLLTAGAYLVAPFPLLKYFFQLDLFELTLLLAAQCIVSLLSATLLGMLL